MTPGSNRRDCCALTGPGPEYVPESASTPDVTPDNAGHQGPETGAPQYQREAARIEPPTATSEPEPQTPSSSSCALHCSGPETNLSEHHLTQHSVVVNCTQQASDVVKADP